MENYTKDGFPRVKAILEPVLAAPMIVTPCIFDETLTTRKFVATAV